MNFFTKDEIKARIPSGIHLGMEERVSGGSAHFAVTYGGWEGVAASPAVKRALEDKSVKWRGVFISYADCTDASLFSYRVLERSPVFRKMSPNANIREIYFPSYDTVGIDLEQSGRGYYVLVPSRVISLDIADFTKHWRKSLLEEAEIEGGRPLAEVKELCEEIITEDLAEFVLRCGISANDITDLMYGIRCDILNEIDEDEEQWRPITVGELLNGRL